MTGRSWGTLWERKCFQNWKGTKKLRKCTRHPSASTLTGKGRWHLLTSTRQPSSPLKISTYVLPSYSYFHLYSLGQLISLKLESFEFSCSFTCYLSHSFLYLDNRQPLYKSKCVCPPNSSCGSSIRRQETKSLSCSSLHICFPPFICFILRSNTISSSLFLDRDIAYYSPSQVAGQTEMKDTEEWFVYERAISREFSQWKIVATLPWEEEKKGWKQNWKPKNRTTAKNKGIKHKYYSNHGLRTDGFGGKKRRRMIGRERVMFSGERAPMGRRKWIHRTDFVELEAKAPPPSQWPEKSREREERGERRGKELAKWTSFSLSLSLLQISLPHQFRCKHRVDVWRVHLSLHLRLIRRHHLLPLKSSPIHVSKVGMVFDVIWSVWPWSESLVGVLLKKLQEKLRKRERERERIWVKISERRTKTTE